MKNDRNKQKLSHHPALRNTTLPDLPVIQWLAETLCFHCRGHGFNLWLEKLHLPCSLAEQKKKRKEIAHSHHCGNPLPHWHPASPLLPRGEQCSQLCAKYPPQIFKNFYFTYV